MLRRWQALVAIVALAAATGLAPQMACAAPASSVPAAMACCKRMKRCATSGHGHACCRKVQSQHEVPSIAVVAVPSPALPVQSRIGAAHAQLALSGEPGAASVEIHVAREAIACTNASPPHRSIPARILFVTFLI